MCTLAPEFKKSKADKWVSLLGFRPCSFNHKMASIHIVKGYHKCYKVDIAGWSELTRGAYSGAVGLMENRRLSWGRGKLRLRSCGNTPIAKNSEQVWKASEAPGSALSSVHTQLFQSSQLPYEVGTIIFSFFQVRKIELTRTKSWASDSAEIQIQQIRLLSFNVFH